MDKTRLILVFIFVMLSAIDCGLTHYMKTHDYPVIEGNPIINYLINNWGWGVVWVYKIILPVLISAAMYLFFNRTGWMRMMAVILVFFGLLVIYMTIFALNPEFIGMITEPINPYK